MVIPSLSRFVGAPVEGSPAEELARALADQGSLSAAESYSRWHEAEGTAGASGTSGVPALAGWYRELLPAEPASVGKPYAFEVDLDKCSGCKACVTACHSLNGLDGLDEGETWREVGLLGSSAPGGGMQHLTTACHHCLEPGCSDGCPTRAYEKDPVTGIVRHLDDQCMGCQYCSLKCPYDVPRYHAGKGIVRKCDMCHGRLEKGEAPACVQACPTKAIRITVADAGALRAAAGRPDGDAPGMGFPAAAPAMAHTIPTTRYVGKAAAEKLAQPAADSRPALPEHAHWPLAVMLPLSQAAIGTWLFWLALRPTPTVPAALTSEWPALALGLFLNAAFLGSSVLHLGRPQVAWKAFLGWRKSWLSREVILFGSFAGLGAAFAAFSALVSIVVPRLFPAGAATLALVSAPLSIALSLAIGLSGLAGLYASSMVYRDTPRPQWATPWTTARFALSAVSLGGLFAASVLAPSSVSHSPFFSVFGTGPVAFLLAVAAIAQLLKPLAESAALRDRSTANAHLLAVSRRLLYGPLAKSQSLRTRLGWALGVAAPLVLLTAWSLNLLPGPAASVLIGINALALSGVEILERSLFFRAAAAPRMPGVAPR